MFCVTAVYYNRKLRHKLIIFIIYACLEEEEEVEPVAHSGL